MTIRIKNPSPEARATADRLVNKYERLSYGDDDAKVGVSGEVGAVPIVTGSPVMASPVDGSIPQKGASVPGDNAESART